MLLTLLKWGLLELGILREALFGLPFFERYSFLFALLIIAIYSCFCFIQEIILRGAVQASLMHFVTGRFAKLRVISTTTLIAMAAHMHLKEIICQLLLAFRTFSGACSTINTAPYLP